MNSLEWLCWNLFLCLSVCGQSITEKEVYDRKELNINGNLMLTMSKTFTKDLLGLSEDLTALDHLREAYKDFTGTEGVNYERVLEEMRDDIQVLLNNKVHAVEDLVKAAEELHKNHTFDKDLDFDYLNNKKILSNIEVERLVNESGEHASKFRSIQLYPSYKFNQLQINENFSTVHVPTTVFDKSAEIINGAFWTEGLNKKFIENNKRDGTLRWQYFCSSDGFFRIYPGIKWPQTNEGGEDDVDMFDCRERSWYIRAATFPKNVVILVDASGSMKGQRMKIAVATVKKIIDTLSNDDYFNVLKYTNKVEYVDNCFMKGKMMVANTENKRRLKKIVEAGLETHNISNTEGALREAFLLLDSAKYDRANRDLCNKAIVLITDSVTETYEWVFKKYNWPNNKTVRVFTYLIGREVSESREVKWMACANKGYYAHIATIADVQENVQEYLKVMSRPMVIQRHHTLEWTPVYLDHKSELDTDKGLNFMTSVSMQVFDTKNKTRKDGNLLGVVGVDVPVDEIKKFVPVDKLGPNGYAFMVNHNGYIMFHRDFRPFQYSTKEGTVSSEGFLNPNYNNIDFMDVEQPVNSVNKMKLEEIRKHMLSSPKGSKKAELLVHYDNMSRMIRRKYSFHYMKVPNTNFSVGIAVPSMHNATLVSSGNILWRECKNDSNLEIAPWQYCNELDSSLQGRERYSALFNIMLQEKQLGLNPNCTANENQRKLVNTLKTDLFVTSDIMKAWARITRSQHIGTVPTRTCAPECVRNCSTVESIDLNDPALPYRQYWARNGIMSVFVGTAGGLTRYLNADNSTTPSPFIKSNLETVTSSYYRHAVEESEEDPHGRIKSDVYFTYSVDISQGFDFNRTVITGSAPVVVRRDNYTRTVAAVVGFQMKYTHFYEKFFNITNQKCQDPACNNVERLCASENHDCYLIDTSGYVIASNYREFYEDIGVFFGHIEGDLMKDFILKRIFISESFNDTQALCDILAHETGSSGASTLLNPIKQLFNGIVWLVAEVALFLSEFSFTVWWSEFTQTRAVIVKLINSTMKPCTKTFSLYYVNEETFNNTAIFESTIDNSKSTNQNPEPLLNTESANQSVEVPNVTANQNQQTQTNQSELFASCQDENMDGIHCQCIRNDKYYSCNRTYMVTRLNNTNLLMVVAARKCTCHNDMAFNVTHTEIKYEEKCEMLKNKPHGVDPPTCIDHSDEENVQGCGQSRIYVSMVLFCVSLYFTLIGQR